MISLSRSSVFAVCRVPILTHKLSIFNNQILITTLKEKNKFDDLRSNIITVSITNLHIIYSFI